MSDRRTAFINFETTKKGENSFKTHDSEWYKFTYQLTYMFFVLKYCGSLPVFGSRSMIENFFFRNRHIKDLVIMITEKDADR